MMKKRIVALLLAGLMTTATLASCRVQGNTDNPGGTEPNQNNNQTTTTKPEDIYNPPSTTFEETDELVYAIGEISLRKEATNSSAELAKIPVETELHCTKKSTSWYLVEYNGQEGYVSKTGVTKNKFVPINEAGSKVMYANAKTINVRLYPNTSAEIKGNYALNDEVTVIASNGSWYKIQYSEDKTYYVSSDCLSEEKVIDPNDTSIYEDLFTPVNGEEGVEKYVSYKLENGEGGKVNFRQSPNLKSTIIMSLSDGVKVTVLKTGTVEDMAWSYIAVKIESDKAGVPSTYAYGYISSDCLSDTNGDMSLDEFIEYYGFNKIDGGMMYYVLKEAKVNIRSTPNVPDKVAGEKDNLITALESGTTPESIKALNVVATGEIDGTTWFMAEYTKKEGDKEIVTRCFVGGTALDSLTTDKNGERVVTIQDLENKYPKLTILETPETKTAKSEAKCFGTDDPEGTVLDTIAAGAEVTVVAKETGSRATWYVIETEEGKFYFVGIEFFN